MCRSAASRRAAEIGREQIEAQYHKALTAALPGEHAAERAALLLAFVAGVQIMRQMIGLSALATCPPAVLTKILGPVFQQAALDGATLQRKTSVELAANPAARRGPGSNSTPFYENDHQSSSAIRRQIAYPDEAPPPDGQDEPHRDEQKAGQSPSAGQRTGGLRQRLGPRRGGPRTRGRRRCGARCRRGGRRL